MAGPYRGRGEPGEIEKNIIRSAQFQAALAHAGIVAYSPNIHDAHWETLNGGSEAAAQTLKRFTEMVLSELADALIVMPEWETSAGTKVEIATAEQRGIPVFYPNSPEDLAEIIKWNKEA